MSYLHVYLNTIANICDSKRNKTKRKETKKKTTTKRSKRKKSEKYVCIVFVNVLRLQLSLNA